MHDTHFVSLAPGYVVQLAPAEVRLIVKESVAKRRAIRFTWLDANRNATSTPEALLPGTVNYLKGPDPARWRTSIPTYERVRAHGVYPGIDVVYYGNGRQLEYDLVVAPHADATHARLGIEGAQARLAPDGDLHLELTDGQVMNLNAPVAYQDVRGRRVSIDARYRLSGNEVSFAVGEYDRDLPLIIDPLIYSTFLGGVGFDDGHAIAVNAAGEAFVTGQTADAATDFPVTPGAMDGTHNGASDVFVTRLNAAGTALLYSTFIGGDSNETGHAIAVNAANEAFVTGYAGFDTVAFPTTAGAFSTTNNAASPDAFVLRLNAAGNALVYSTLLGGAGEDVGLGIAISAANEAYVTGDAEESPDFPTTAGAYDTTFNGDHDAFVTRVNATGTALVYSTFLGGTGEDRGFAIAISGTDALVTGVTADDVTDYPTTAGAFDTTHNGGDDAFVTRVDTAGSVLEYSTFLGGGGDDQGNGIAVAGNEAHVTGATGNNAIPFPVTAGAFDTTQDSDDAFVTRPNVAGTALVYSTLLGGDGFDAGNAIAVNGGGEAFVAGFTVDTLTFPTTPGAFDVTHNDALDAFVTRLNASGTALVYSSFLGGLLNDEGRGIAIAGSDAFVTGYTESPANFPTTPGAIDTTQNGSRDAFVARFATGGGGFTLTVTGAGNDNGTITGPGINCESNGGTTSGDCTEGFVGSTVVTLTATPGGSSVFTGWSGDPDCADGTVTMNADKTCTATFVDSQTLEVTPAGNGAGTVTSSPTGINCPTDCIQDFPTGTVVTLTATPASGSTFSGWTGSPDCTDGIITLDDDVDCTATFILAAAAEPIPTLSQWMSIVMGVLLIGTALRRVI